MNVYRLITWGGLGDLLLSTPCFKAIKENDTKSRIIVFCGGNKNRKEIFKYNPYIDKVRSFSFFSDPISGILFKFKMVKFHYLNYGRVSPGLFYNKRAPYIISDLLNIQLNDSNIQIYLTRVEDEKAKNLLRKFKKTIVIHINSKGTNKNWITKNWSNLICKYPDYQFIQIGLAEEDVIEGAVDLRGKTTLREAFAIIKNSVSFVGIDSVFSHATNAFGIPGVVLFGPSNPMVWGHPNNINLYKPVRCAPCMDFLLNSICPYNKLCMENISIDDVSDALDIQLIKQV